MAKFRDELTPDASATVDTDGSVRAHNPCALALEFDVPAAFHGLPEHDWIL